MEVIHQGQQALFQSWQVLLQLGKVVLVGKVTRLAAGVGIPATKRDRHTAGAGLDQAACREKILVVHRGPVVDGIQGPFPVTLAGAGILLLQVEGLEKPAGGEQFQCLPRVGIGAFQHAGGIDVPPVAIDRAEQLATVAEAFPGNGQLHVCPALVSWLERLVGGAGETGPARILPVVGGGVAEADEGGDGWTGGPLQPGDSGPQGGLLPLDRVTVSITTETEFRGVLVLGTDQGTDDRELVQPGRQPWQVLADLYAGQAGLDGLELAADLGRGIWFEVPDVQVRWAAGKEDHDD